MTCPGPVHKEHGTVLLLIWKQEMMQGVFVAILTFSLGTGKCKGDRKPLRNSVLICVRRDFVCQLFFTSTALHPFSFDASLTGWGLALMFLCFKWNSLSSRGCSKVPLHLLWHCWLPEHLLSQQAAHIHPAQDKPEGAGGSDDGFRAGGNSLCGKDQNESLQQETWLLLVRVWVFWQQVHRGENQPLPLQLSAVGKHFWKIWSIFSECFQKSHPDKQPAL